MLFWPLNPIYTQIPNSPTSIIWAQTNFPSSLTTISGFLNRCFFDLSTRFVLKFRLPDLDYPRSDQVPTIVGHYYKFLKPMFFWPQMQTNTHTTYFFHMTLLTVEGIWSISFSFFLRIATTTSPGQFSMF